MANTDRVTVADVARYAGVSSAVVSYVVNNGPRPVAPATARRVRHAIDVLHYRPNSTARALRTGRSGVLGLVMPGTSNPFFGEYADALHIAAAAAGVGVLTAGSGGRVDSELAAVDQISRREIDGLIVATSIVPADVPALRRPAVTTVLIDCPFPVPGFTTIGPDAATGAQDAVEHLLVRHGHASVALVAGDDADHDGRRQGWASAHTRNRRQPGPTVTTAYSRAGGCRGVAELLAADRSTSAVLVASDLQAVGVLHHLAVAEIRVPEDVAVVSFDGTGIAAYTNPTLTVSAQPIEAMAAAAVAAVLDAAPPQHQAFAMTTIVRTSCGCQAAHR